MTIPPHEFALSRVEERWIVEHGEPRLLELRAESGRSSCQMRDGIVHLDAASAPFFPDAGSHGGDEDRLFSSLLDVLPPRHAFHVRRLRISRTVRTAKGSTNVRTEKLVAIRGEGASIVLPLDGHAADAMPDLVDLTAAIDAEAQPAAWHELPVAWLNGSAAILFHEAIGHPAEQGAPPAAWPRWLRVLDDPRYDGIGRLDLDDTGRRVDAADLTTGEAPAALRREGYRDLPLRRMSNLVVESHREVDELPVPRIEVLMLGGGRWDPRTDIVEIRVAAARRVTSSRTFPLLPFTWRVARSALPGLLEGCRGEITSFPGVLCSNEGQRIAVGSFAPVLLTREVGR